MCFPPNSYCSATVCFTFKPQFFQDGPKAIAGCTAIVFNVLAFWPLDFIWHLDFLDKILKWQMIHPR